MVGMTFWKLISQAFPPLSLSLSSFLFFPALLLHRALHLTRKRAGNSAFKKLAWASFMWQLFQWLSHLYERYLTTVGFVFICCRRRMDCQYIWKADMEFLWPGSLSYCQAFLIKKISYQSNFFVYQANLKVKQERCWVNLKISKGLSPLGERKTGTNHYRLLTNGTELTVFTYIPLP